MQKNNGGETQQHHSRQIQHDCAPTLIFEQAIANRIDRAEVHQQRREYNESRVVKEGYRQVEVSVGSQRSVKMEDKSDDTKAREMENERRASALAKDDKQANA